MKICLFTHTLPRFKGDTAAPFIGVLAEKLSEFSNDVVVLAPFDNAYNFNEKRKYKLITYKYIFPNKFHLLGYSKTLKGDKFVGFLNILLSPFLYLFGFIALLKTIHNEHIDIICSHWIIPNGFISAIVGMITKTPFTTTIPGSDVYLAGKNPLFKWMTDVASRRASYVISDSQHYIKQLNDLSIYPRKTKIIRYGVDETKFNISKKNQKLVKKLKLNKNNRIILAVGRFVAKKGFIYLVRAMKKIIQNNKNAKLILIGDGEDDTTLRSEIVNLGLTNNIILPGMISHELLVRYYQLADVFVMPSIKDENGNIDASPVSMMEAMACGLPIVATSYAVDKELMVSGKTGFLIKEKNYIDIADAVLKILSKKSKQVKKSVRKIAVVNFSSKNTAEKYLQCFQDSIYSDYN